MTEPFLVKQDVQFGLVIAVVVDLLVVKGERFNDLVRAVKLGCFISEPSVAANRCKLDDQVGKR